MVNQKTLRTCIEFTVQVETHALKLSNHLLHFTGSTYSDEPSDESTMIQVDKIKWAYRAMFYVEEVQGCQMAVLTAQNIIFSGIELRFNPFGGGYFRLHKFLA